MKKIINYFICTSLVCIMGCVTPVKIEDGHDNELREQALSLFKPLNNAVAQGELLSAEKISLGRTLFFDKRISANGETGCAQCHQPEFYGTSGPADKLAGSADQFHNIPTVLNASLNFANNWYVVQLNSASSLLVCRVSGSIKLWLVALRAAHLTVR